jgi:uncharacterized membrane protein
LLICGVALVGAITIVISAKTQSVADLSLRYAEQGSNEALQTAARAISDAGFGGTGAGTFASLMQFYSNSSSILTSHAPTFAASLVVEFGAPTFWLMTVFAVIFVALFARGALERGRDFFYPLAGAGTAAAVLLSLFYTDGPSSAAVTILVSGTFGLALAQRISRGRL